MAVKLASVRANLTREDEGDWQAIPDLPGVELKVRSLMTPSYRVARDQLIQKWARRYGKKPVPVEEQDAEFGKLFAEHLLRGWRGFDVSYTPAIGLEELTRPDARELRRHVEWAAGEIAAVQVEFEADAAKN